MVGWVALLLSLVVASWPESSLSLRTTTCSGRALHHSARLSAMAGGAGASATLLPLEKPANTENAYEQFYLDNGMAVMLTSLPASEKSSAALYLKAGAQDDFEGRAGLAHFTEHAVFLGSHTFPVENAFKTFMSKNGGSSNGGTAMEHTSFQFQVNHEAFSEALEIWSHFFVDPLFTADAITREIMAVDAEDSKNRILDTRRMLQCMKDVLVTSTGYKKFSTGNVQTLARGDAAANGAELAEEMKRFYSLHYRPSCMTLSLVGPQPLHELRQLAEAKFAQVRGGGPAGEHECTPPLSPTPSLYSGVFPFEPRVVSQTMRVKPVKDIRDLSLLIPLPPTRELHDAPPTRLLAMLLSHKAEGSLFALLQDKGWATAVSGGERSDYSDFSIFEISVALTVEGLAHYADVVEAVWSYLSVVEAASDADLQRIWDEMQVLGEIDFAFQEKSTAYELAPFLARQMQQLPLHKVLSSGWLLGPLDLPLLRRDFLSRLSPDRALTVLRSQSFTALPDDGAPAIAAAVAAAAAAAGSSEIDQQLGTMHVEQWYKTPYGLKPEDSDVQARWAAARRGNGELQSPNPRLHLPLPNPYVSPELTELIKPAQPHKLRSAPPVEVAMPDTSPHQRQRVRVFRSQDEAFNQPRFVVHALLHSVGHSSLTREGPHPVLSLAAAVFQQTEARNLYFAGRAGLSHSFSVGSRGLGLTVSGFSPKLPLLLETVAKKVGSVEYWTRSIDPAVVEICKERQLRSMRSWTKERPDAVADGMLAHLLQEDARLPPQRIALAEEATPEMLAAAMRAVLRRARLSVYVHGDPSRGGDEQTALDCAKGLVGLLGEDMAWDEVENHQQENGWGVVDRVLRARLLPQDAKHSQVLLDSFNQEDPNSALLLHLQTTTRSPAASALSLLLTTFLREPAFNELRTKRQLGYIVQTAASGFGSQHASMRGITFRVLSQRYGPQEMLTAVDEFIESQSAAFSALTQTDVDSRAASIIKSLEDPPTGYEEESGLFWSAIVENQPFDWVEQVIAELRALRVEKLQEAFSTFVARNEKRRSVALMIESKAHKKIRQDSVSAANGGLAPLTLEQLTELRDSLPFVEAIAPVAPR